MLRRDFFKGFIQETNKPKFNSSFEISNNSLEEYDGEWTKDEASHLLRRALFGYTIDQLNSVISNGLNSTVEELLNDSEPLPEPPRKFYTSEMINDGLEFGDFYHDKRIVLGAEVTKTIGFQIWWLMQIHKQGISLKEKMTFFWQNHFGTSANAIEYARFNIATNQLCREYSLGNFKELVYKMGHDHTMMLFLNGNENLVGQPNENYARELFELFTVGKGELVEKGNYTNYTEQDITEAAKVLTGWFFSLYWHETDYAISFYDHLHDFSTKTFSSIFNNKVIEGKGESEYDELIDMIFESDAVSKYIVRKIYKWFVFYEISDEVEEFVISPLAQLFRNNNYDVKPVLSTLFKSKHFYEMSLRGAMIKSPVDFVSDLIKATNVELIQGQYENEEQLRTEYLAYLNNYLGFCERLGQEPASPSSVAGFEAYYQVPSYYRIWLSSSTLPLRIKLTEDIFSYSGTDTDRPIYASPLNFVSDFEFADNPNRLLEFLIGRFISVELNDIQIKALKDIIVPNGLEDYTWTKAWNDYKSNKENEIYKSLVENKLNDLMKSITKLPEYQLM